MDGKLWRTLFGGARGGGGDDEGYEGYELTPSLVYAVGGPMVLLYPLGVIDGLRWIAFGGFVVTLAVSRDAYRLRTTHGSDWRWAYYYPFVFVLGFLAYPLLLVVYLYHRRRATAALADRTREDVEQTREELDVPRPRKVYWLLAFDVVLQVVVLGSVSGPLLAAPVVAYLVALPLHGLYVGRDIGAVRSAGVEWGRSAILHGLSGVAFVLVLVYLFQRSERVYYTALERPELAEDEEEPPPGAESAGRDTWADRANL